MRRFRIWSKSRYCPNRREGSGAESLHSPSCLVVHILSAEEEPVVEPIISPLPELDLVGPQKISAPVIRTRDLASLESLLDLSASGPRALRGSRESGSGQRAQAPIWLPRVRVRKYASDSSGLTSSTRPLTRTCRCRSGQ